MRRLIKRQARGRSILEDPRCAVLNECVHVVSALFCMTSHLITCSTSTPASGALSENPSNEGSDDLYYQGGQGTQSSLPNAECVLKSESCLFKMLHIVGGAADPNGSAVERLGIESDRSDLLAAESFLGRADALPPEAMGSHLLVGHSARRQPWCCRRFDQPAHGAAAGLRRQDSAHPQEPATEAGTPFCSAVESPGTTSTAASDTAQPRSTTPNGLRLTGRHWTLLYN